MRFFNTAGPINPADHYNIPPLTRFDLDEMLFLIQQKKYFILHAPRQVGKTSYLLALMDYLNTQDDYTALYINVEVAQAAREDVTAAMRSILSELGSRAEWLLKDPYPTQIWPDVLAQTGGNGALSEVLNRWSQANPKPIILLIDEIDSLVGDTLISVLRQLRAGYDKRPAAFPQSVILCGVRDVRDYRLHTDTGKAVITGGSAFNIKAKSLRLGSFNQDEVEALLQEHTTETGQVFEPAASNLIWELTQGQPWLVNALAYEVCFDMKANRDHSVVITAEMVAEAKENLILRRETHLDQLVDKLKEPRVQQVISPMLRGQEMENVPPDHIQYVLDLGLVSKVGQELKIANPIYQEVIPRELTYVTQFNFAAQYKPAWYINDVGALEMEKLLAAFQQFFREHSESWVERFDYKEAGPQLLMQAFLQRLINGGGQIQREYGLGRRRTDLLILWPYGEGQVQRVVIELKILYSSLEATIEEGLAQTWQYMDHCGTDKGHLIIFDRRPHITWDEKVFRREESHQGQKIVVWGM
jgi:hypothetical protein